MLLNQVTHVLFIHAHFLLFLPTYGYKVMNLYIVLIVILLWHDHRILSIRKSELCGVRAELRLNHRRRIDTLGIRL